MRLLPLSLVIPAIALTAGCAQTGAPAAGAAAPRQTEIILAMAPLRAADGAARGNATLIAIGERVELRIAATGLTAGTLGAHLHMTGKCEGPAFQSAGGHLNPGNRKHGAQNPDGSHLGDLPNIMIGADGKGVLSVPIAEARAPTENVVFDADGTAVVIHAQADDYKTDPTGNSGGRIVCGVLAKS